MGGVGFVVWTFSIKVSFCFVVRMSLFVYGFRVHCKRETERKREKDTERKRYMRTANTANKPKAFCLVFPVEVAVYCVCVCSVSVSVCGCICV